MKKIEWNDDIIIIDDRWRGYEFSQAEVENLLAGNSIDFDVPKKNGEIFHCEGKYEETIYRGIPRFMFIPKGYQLVTWNGERELCHLPLVSRIQQNFEPSEEQLQILLTGEILEVDFERTKKGEQIVTRERVHIYWDGVQGSKWLALARYTEDHEEISRENHLRFYQELEEIRASEKKK